MQISGLGGGGTRLYMKPYCLNSCPSFHSGFTHVESDSMSIVGVEARSIGTSILRSYYFQVQRGWDDHIDHLPLAKSLYAHKTKMIIKIETRITNSQIPTKGRHCAMWVYF